MNLSPVPGRPGNPEIKRAITRESNPKIDPEIA